MSQWPVSDSYYNVNVRAAVKYGLDGGIFLTNLYFWITQNAANERNQHDGKYWSYNTLEAFEKLFPFWTRAQLRRIINNLETDGAIEKGNHSDKSTDRTVWYTLSEKALKLFTCSSKKDDEQLFDDEKEEIEKKEPANAVESPYAETSICICQNQHMHMSKPAYVYNDTDIKRRYKTKGAAASARAQEDADSSLPTSEKNIYDVELGRVITAYQKLINPTHSTAVVDEIAEFLESMDADTVEFAINEAADNKARRWAYVRAILNRYKKDGITTLAEAKHSAEERTERIERSKAARKDAEKKPNAAKDYEQRTYEIGSLENIIEKL